jgi:CHAD domain-containing protein
VAKQNKYPSVALSKGMTLETAFNMMAFNCLSQLESNASILAKTYDVEALHQMRVGMRRFGSFLNFYDDILQIPKALKLELQWLSRRLGKTRDSDVLIYSTLPMLNKKSNDLWEHLSESFAVYLDVEEKHKKITSIINSQRYIEFFERLEYFFLMDGWRKKLSLKKQILMTEEIEIVASLKLTKLHKRLVGMGKHIDIRQNKKVHRIRVAAKQLRYSAELLQSLYPSKKASAYIKKLAKLQDYFGFLNDLSVANQLFSKMKNRDEIFQNEKQLIKLKLRKKRPNKSRKIDSLWAEIKSTPLFWKV